MLIFCVPALAVPVSGTHVARCTLALRLALCSLPVPVIVPPAKSFTKPEPFPLQFPSIAVRLSPLISFQRERSLYAHAVSLSLSRTLAWAMEYLCPSLLVFVTYKSGLANHSNTRLQFAQRDYHRWVLGLLRAPPAICAALVSL